MKETMSVFDRVVTSNSILHKPVKRNEILIVTFKTKILKQ